MIDAHVELSQKSYLPGQELAAVITLSRAGTVQSRSRKGSVDQSYTSTKQKRRHSRSSSKDDWHGLPELDLKQIGPTSPVLSSPTSPEGTRNTEPIKGHSRTRSITFDTSTESPSRARRSSRPNSILLVEDKQLALPPEHLLIVYVQIHGKFSVDGSYLQEEELSTLREQAMSSTTGGIVANSTVTHSRWSFGNWTNVLATSSQPSSIADLRQAASSNTLPILTMPPTIFEIGVSLKPGERTRRNLSFILPSCLPPTYNGKVMNISYAIKLSAQREDHSTTTFECPVQILPSPPSSQTDQYIFLQPHILRQSSAQVTTYNTQNKSQSASISTKEDFIKFIEALKDPDSSLPSPILESRQFLARDTQNSALPLQAKKDLGLRFDVSRGKDEQVCKVTMQKSRFAPGEVITGTIDFRNAQLHCFQCTVTLECAESIDSEYAATSMEKIQLDSTRRLGRDVLVTTNSIQRDFSVGIPADSTPSFKTTPLTLNYSLFFKFILHDQNSLVTETRIKHGIDTTPIEHVVGQAFDCRVPITLITPESLTFGTSSKWGEL